jgi:hypothetical protein
MNISPRKFKSSNPFHNMILRKKSIDKRPISNPRRINTNKILQEPLQDESKEKVRRGTINPLALISLARKMVSQTPTKML